MFRRLSLTALAFLCLIAPLASGQDLPQKIRGYRVHNDTIRITAAASEGGPARVTFSDPAVTDLSLAGVTFEVALEIFSERQSGKVEFLTFHDLRVNGVSVEIAEYRHPFAFRKGKAVRLPQPFSILLPTRGLVAAAWKEMRESRETWAVTGRIFVFGRFRRFGFDHKRVVPVDIELTIPNPVKGR